MLTKVGVLEKENANHLKHIISLREEINKGSSQLIDLPDESFASPSNRNTVQIGSEHERKLLIISDEHGKNLDRNILKHLDNGKYRVESVIKPGAHYDSVLEGLERTIKNYNSDDYVVVVAGSNDFLTGSRPKFYKIHEKIGVCFIFLACPSTIKSQSSNNLIQQFNNCLKQIINTYNTTSNKSFDFINININHGIKVRNWLIGKMIAESIQLSVLQSKLMNKETGSASKLTQVNQSILPTDGSQNSMSPQALDRTGMFFGLGTSSHSISLFDELNTSCDGSNMNLNCSFLGGNMTQIKGPPQTA
ncbi:unnamed protein product [Ceutorhynchus assimilis]|uniref:Uncharacterized protein n=1 Tax=Ceutorhynchus assimilis TaxID=467358 RepID=A0A9N9MGW4_9CUCU|nr:unnamed protein product [Ceutorhynchus assimilis]